MIVSVPFTFQVRSFLGLVKLETELAQGEILRIQMLELVQRCLGHCQPATSYFLKRHRPALH